ncbi:MAG: hypothetical protein FJ255_05335 [Phycisphaerae bacterium]|nr:hypothetical protein [Phycisphaerae bacterium]
MGTVVALTAGLACAAPPSWHWQWAGSPNNNDSIKMISPTRDGGYLAVGQRTLAGGQSDVLIMRLSNRGALLWERTVNTGPSEIGYSIIETSDGGIALAGENLPGAAWGGVFLLKLSRAGVTTWGLQYPSNVPMAPGVAGARVIEASTRNLILAGRAAVAQTTWPMIAAVSPNGVPVWQIVYQDGRYGTPSTGGLVDVRESLSPAGPPGLILAAGYTTPALGALREPLVLCVQLPNGAPVSSSVYAPPPADAYATAIEELPGQGFAITANTLLPPGVLPRSGLIVQTIPAPPFVNSGPWWVYNGFQPGITALAYEAPGFPPTPNMVMAGTTLPPNPLGQNKMTLLVTNAGPPGTPPNPIQYWVYGGPAFEAGNSVVAVERGYTLAGDTNSFPPGPALIPHAYFVRADRAGLSTCNEAPVPPQPQPFPGIFQPFMHNPFPIQVVPFAPQALLTPDALINLCFYCDADLNLDGAVDFNDLLVFLNLYNVLSPDADVNDDGVIDFNDFLAYLNLYNVICP